MPGNYPENPRAAAQRRVRDSFERQATRLDRFHEEARKRDALAQSRSLERAAQTVRELEERKREALERHDRLWEEERRKFAPAAAPAFGFGGPGRRPDPRAHKLAAERFAGQREEIERLHDERLNACREQAERMRDQFSAASQAREKQQSRERERLFREQADSFERRTLSEQARSGSQGEEKSADKSLTREFGQRSRDSGPDIAD